jgi:hypothetical protein
MSDCEVGGRGGECRYNISGIKVAGVLGGLKMVCGCG